VASAVTAAHVVKIDEVREPERNAATGKVAAVVVEEVAVMVEAEVIRAVPIGNNNPERLAEAAQSRLRLEKNNMKRSVSRHEESQNARQERDRVSLRMKVSATSLLTE